MDKYANIGSRFLALLIDSIILSVIFSIISVTYFGVIGMEYISFLFSEVGVWNWNIYRMLFGLDYFFFYLLILTVIWLLYYALFESSVRGATIGKMILGIKVVDENDRKLDFGTAFVRSIGRIFSGFFYIGYIIAFATEGNQALHDKIAGTYVISAKYSYTEVISSKKHQTTTVQKPSPSPSMPYQNTAYNAPKLIAVSGQLAGMSFPVDSRGVMIGRDPSCCGVVMHKDTIGISRHHCTVAYNRQTGMFILNDCGSSYGTFTSNGMRVVNGQPVALRNGERFYLGSPSNSFEVRTV